ncbi:MAG TPA: PTS mannose transporter subunit IIAB [Clostridiaceae bacterium]|jgi:PTS system mannose-specific IIA component|uniref:PTS sugar transporter subunit IIA n=1 Tax=Clostridium tyrobutyricum TaxID=1519 RepID=UPI000E834027|nr:PTS mannose transporter subunit IIAB [Clostridium tyrobutyricum]HBN28456.1 PTS mannose transporter subunit IIAB [Clostridiaceae bacterium]HBX48330.1 PTS mannose transporter subunit IIAB [Clostridiaceae bacterium]
MNKKAALIITHGFSGKELLKSVEMIMGEQKNVKALGLSLGESVDDLKNTADNIVVENQKAGLDTIILVDILGGSPSNVALYLLKKYKNIKLITGVNMPMLIEFFQSRDSNELDELTQLMINSASDGIKKFENNVEG